MLEIVTIYDLIKALKNTLGKKGMDDVDIKLLAEYVMNFFGFNDAVVDNRLNSKDRDVFYMLEEEGILKTGRDEVNIQKGKIWRIHYWELNKPTVERLIALKKPVPVVEEKLSIYDEISDDMWQHGNKEEDSSEK